MNDKLASDFWTHVARYAQSSLEAINADNRIARFDSPLLTKAEVADKLRVSIRTVERLIDDGVLVALRIRGTWRVHPVALEDYLCQTQSSGGGE